MRPYPVHPFAPIRAIHPDPPQLFPRATEPGKQHPCPSRIGHQSSGHHHDHEHAHRIHQDMPRASRDLLARIMAPNPRDRGAFDALTVQTAHSRMCVTTGLSPHRRA